MPNESRADREERLGRYEVPAFRLGLALHHARNLMALVAAVGQMYGGNAYHRHMQAEAALIERYIREGQCELAALEQYPYTHREVAQHGGNEQRT